MGFEWSLNLSVQFCSIVQSPHSLSRFAKRSVTLGPVLESLARVRKATLEGRTDSKAQKLARLADRSPNEPLEDGGWSSDECDDLPARERMLVRHDSPSAQRSNHWLTLETF